MMLIGNNAGVLRTQETGNVQRSPTPDLPAEETDAQRRDEKIGI